MSVFIIGEYGQDIEILQHYLRKLGMTNIQYITTVEEALDQLESVSKEEIDFILYDAVLTNRTKIDICRQIECLYKMSNSPIIMTVNFNEIEKLEYAFEVGLFDLIPKPMDFIHFKGRVLSALKYREAVKLREREEEHFQSELLLAKKVQKSALTPSLYERHIQYDGLYVPSDTLSGDMYCWFKIDENVTAILLYDVMGHGVAASLVSMSIRSLLKDLITKCIDPVLVITELNRQVYELFSDESEMDSFLLTAVYVLIDTKNATIQYVNASHPHGFLFDKGGETVILSSNTPILGLFPTIRVKKETLTLAQWNRIILYTDGIFTLNENRCFDSGQFYPYMNLENSHALKCFAEDYRLFDQHYNDDITIVSITIGL